MKKRILSTMLSIVLLASMTTIVPVFADETKYYSYTFPSLYQGYSQPSLTLGFTYSTGWTLIHGDLGGYFETHFEGGNSSAFTASPTYLNLRGSGSIDVTVRPISGLAPGTYSTRLVCHMDLHGSTFTHSFVGYYYYDLSFTVLPRTYNVTFVDWDDRILKTQNVTSGSDVIAPDDPVRIGYTFIGWDGSFTNVTDNLIVRALYEVIKPVEYTAVITLYSGETPPPTGTELILYDCYGDALATVTTDENGAVSKELTYAEFVDGVYIKSTQSFGSLLTADKTKFYAGSLYKLNQDENNLAFLKSGDVEITGRVVSDDTFFFSVSGANIIYINPLEPLCRTDNDGFFSFKIDQRNIRHNSLEFLIESTGFKPKTFYVSLEDEEMMESLISNGSIDFDNIMVNRIGQFIGSSSISITPPHYQRGKDIQVDVKYSSNYLISGTAQINITIPEEKVYIDPDSVYSNVGYNIDVQGGTLTFNQQSVVQGHEYEVTFYVRADLEYRKPNFIINASISGGDSTWSIGSAIVTLSDIELDVPAEVGFSGNDSEPFDILITASRAENYTIDVEITAPDGSTAEINKNLKVIPSTNDSGLWIREKDIYIKNAMAGIYTVIAELKDDKGDVVATTTNEITIRPRVLRLTGIELNTSYLNTKAPEPIISMSFATGTIWMGADSLDFYLGLYPVTLSVEFADTDDITMAAMSMETSKGTFPATNITRTATGFDGYFAAGSYKGSGFGTISLKLTRTDGTKLCFTPARLTLMVDPSGYVYNKATGKPIEGATVLLQELDDSGNWFDWDAENYAQHNPQTTDTEGRYGWFVPNGKYRVLVSAEQYEDYCTEFDALYGVITIPPPRMDIDIGLVAIKTDAKASLRGKILSYNPKTPITIKLIKGENIAYTTATQAIERTGQAEQEFIFEGVEPDTYTLEIIKPAHCKFTVKNIVVGEGGLDLTEDSRSEVHLMTLRCGDINGDGVIDDRDLTILWLSSNYFKNTMQAANPLCDFNGDGVIDDRDLTILWQTYSYYRGEIVIE